MATFALTDAEIHAGGYDLTCDVNQVNFEVSVEALDSTTFCSDGARERTAGLRDVNASVNGFRDNQAVLDAEVFNTILGNQRVFTVAVDDVVGSVAYFANLRKFSYNQTAEVGSLAGFSLSGSGSDGIGAVRGSLLFPKGAVTGSANGTGVELGDVSATERLFTSIHVFEAGTTATVIVESDDNSGFTTATTRSSTVVTATGGTFVAPVSGAITDTHWRVRFASVTGSFSIAVAVGIQ